MRKWVRKGARGDLASEHDKHHRELATSLYKREALKVRDTLSGNDPEMGNHNWSRA